jgi:hypothetical protein
MTGLSRVIGVPSTSSPKMTGQVKAGGHICGRMSLSSFSSLPLVGSNDNVPVVRSSVSGNHQLPFSFAIDWTPIATS